MSIPASCRSRTHGPHRLLPARSISARSTARRGARKRRAVSIRVAAAGCRCGSSDILDVASVASGRAHLGHVEGQPKGEIGPQDDQCEHHQHRQMERDVPRTTSPQFASRYSNDEQVDADRRRDFSPKLDEEDENDANRSGSTPYRQDREDQRHGDDDHAQASRSGSRARCRRMETAPRELKPRQTAGRRRTPSPSADAGEADRIGQENAEKR